MTPAQLVNALIANTSILLTRGERQELELSASVQWAKLRRDVAALERGQCAAILANKAMLCTAQTDPAEQAVRRALLGAKLMIEARGPQPPGDAA